MPRSQDLVTFPIQQAALPPLKKRLNLAIKIDEAEKSTRKSTSHNEWFTKRAKELDVELDDGLILDVGDEHEQLVKKMKTANQRVRSWREAGCTIVDSQGVHSKPRCGRGRGLKRR